LLAAVLAGFSPAFAFAQTDDALAAEEDEENPYRPGLIARYQGADGKTAVRLEDSLSLVWDDRSPDRRIASGPFSATFEGRLWTQAPGTYRLHVYAAGKVRLKLGKRVLVDAHLAEPGWLAAEPVELEFGFQPLVVEYRRQNEPARISLYWEGPQFGFEPVAGRWLLHDREQTPSAGFERGAELARALRCAACHAIPGENERLAGPALDRLQGNVSRAWLVDWLAADQSKTTHRRMPHFALDRSEAASIADALLAASEPLPAATRRPPAPPAAPKKKKKDEPPPPKPSAELGGTLFRSIGCLACHQAGELGSGGLFGGGDLTHVASKRPADFFASWLLEPERHNRDHRMPVFPLDAVQLESLSRYLQTLDESPHDGPNEAAPADRQRGAELIAAARCADCHALPKALANRAPRAPHAINLASLEEKHDANCLGEPAPDHARPGYRLNDADRQAVKTFLTATIGQPTVPPTSPRTRTGHDLLVERNCLSCHARGFSGGMSARLPAVAEADPSLRDVLPALDPPALFGIGDKLHDEALLTALDAPDPPRRPWLHVRMPKFNLSPAESRAIVEHFIAADRIPERPRPAQPAETVAATSTALEAAGPRLVTADGFGCTSCHAIGEWTPTKVALNAQGTSLSHLGRRIRREWFDRWVRNPARIVPKMEMPSVQQSIRGVLAGDLDAQLSAVWDVLNREKFTPPSPSALRVVRRANLPNVTEPAAVLTDVIEVGGRPFTKPFVIGLDNRHNVLVDLATARLAAWWIGDVARQNTRGKTWFWEAGVPQLLPVDHSEDEPSDLALALGGPRIAPAAAGQFVTEVDRWEHVEGGIRFAHRLHFPEGDATYTTVATQEFTRLPEGEGQTGFFRRVFVGESNQDSAFELVALPGRVTLSSDGRTATLAGPKGTLQVSVVNPKFSFRKSPRGAIVSFYCGELCELRYTSEAVPDEFALLPEVDRRLAKASLDVVPGFEAIRLPVSDQPMPTGIAWRPDGSLVVSSLEGRVWIGRDMDADGLIDDLRPISDDLAAPYGVAVVDERTIDVINKYGLLRLIDADGDGRAERTELLASGWGHTRDYHDWAVGLPRDAAGNYYAALPCQQDDRSEAAANVRGRVIKLVPRDTSYGDPRRYAVEVLTAGHRFPHGIALDAHEELFVTDNQGNYTPFNELNHVVAGHRYGFINKLENKPGFDPPFRPAAVNIPHPWTRSVNGICFLSTPPAAREKNGHDFGPYEGHLIGCEYDTRRLVRMSLEKIGGDHQGAVYPFSIEPAAGAETFEGPLVCQVSPAGELYVGSIRDSGWGAGSNTGSLVRLRPSGELPAGIAEVRAARGGFKISFAAPVDRRKAADPASYAISSFRRVPTPAYGGDDQDRRVERPATIVLADDARSVTITLDELREGFVYEFHLRNLAESGRFFPDEAYYTLLHKL